MFFVILAIVSLPCLIVMAILFIKNNKIRRARRMEAYRRSPESQILRLND